MHAPLERRAVDKRAVVSDMNPIFDHSKRFEEFQSTLNDFGVTLNDYQMGIAGNHQLWKFQKSFKKTISCSSLHLSISVLDKIFEEFQTIVNGFIMELGNRETMAYTVNEIQLSILIFLEELEKISRLSPEEYGTFFNEIVPLLFSSCVTFFILRYCNVPVNTSTNKGNFR